MKSKKNQVILWKDILDLGVTSSLAFLKKKKTEKEALRELKGSLLRQSQEHWEGLYQALKKLNVH